MYIRSVFEFNIIQIILLMGYCGFIGCIGYWDNILIYWLHLLTSITCVHCCRSSVGSDQISLVTELSTFPQVANIPNIEDLNHSQDEVWFWRRCAYLLAGPHPLIWEDSLHNCHKTLFSQDFLSFQSSHWNSFYR